VGPLAELLGGVVVASDQAVVTDVEELLARMGVNLSRKGDGECAPSFAALLPRLACADVEAGVGEDERDRQVRPQGGGAEVERIEVVPPKKTARTAETRARIGARPDALSIERFDAYRAPVEDAAVAAARIRREDRALILGRNPRFEAEKPASLKLGGECEAVRTDPDVELRRCVPALVSTMRGDRLGQE